MLLETIDLKKTYRSGRVDVEALRGVNIQIRSGELVAIMGPSGCGKSTLMHLLGAMSRATSGKVLIEDKNIAGMNDAQRTDVRRTKLGFVFQKLNLLPTLTARDNIGVARAIQGSAADPQVDEYLADILKLLKIDDKADRKPAELSGGEQQRFAIARAVSHRPALVLADEPTGALDSKNSEIVLQMFRELNRKFQQTILLVTHNPELAAYADRLIEMRDGLVVHDSGHVAPAVAGIIGDMKRFLLWSFDRGSVQYDVICGLILAFIFLVPGTSFNDRPGYMRVFSTDPEIKATSENGITVYTVKLKSAAFWDDNEHQQLALKSLQDGLNIPVENYRMKPIYTTIGMTIAYAIWVEEVK